MSKQDEPVLTGDDIRQALAKKAEREAAAASADKTDSKAAASDVKKG